MTGRPLIRPSAEQDQLLRAAFHPDLAVASKSAEAWARALDLDTLDFMSVQMLPTLADRADELPLDPELTTQIMNVSRVTWLRTESHARSVAPAIADLRAEGCDPVLLKGAAIVFGHGVSARLRPMFDIDVLVDAARVDRAAELLIERGFTARDAAGLLRRDARLLALKHGEEFARGDGISLDVHWSALSTIRRPELGEMLRENAVECAIAGAQCRSLGRSDLTAVTIAHAADPRRSLRERWVGDCVLLLRGHEADVDWDLIARRGREWRISTPIVEAFDYLRGVAGVELPAPTRRALSRDPVPIAMRARRRGATPRAAGPAVRLIEDYELEIADSAQLGRRTGPADFLDFLVRRRGLTRRRQLPGDVAFSAAGRPWRVRRKLRDLLGLSLPDPDTSAWPRCGLGEELRFRGAGARDDVLDSGWWFAEDFGTWSRGGFSRLRFALDTPIDGPAQLSVGVRAPIAEAHPTVRVDVIVNDHRVSRFTLDSETPATTHGVRIPAEAIAGRTGVEVAFVVSPTAIPAELGLAPDPREIGIGLGELVLSA